MNEQRPLIHSPFGPMSEVLAAADQVAKTTTRVLITGESGVGKELLALYLHAKSKRREEHFEAVNCAGVTESILQAEMFGHKRGAFTGAVKDRKGRIELADKGTLFLDEIGDMTPNMQAALLRFMETGILEKVGDDDAHKIPVDVRIIAATNRNLEKEAENGSFRPDLLYRLEVFPINIPPLRERKDDIAVLIKYFLPLISSRLSMPEPDLSGEAHDALMGYYWPGNVRELQNLIERLTICYAGKTVGVEHLPSKITSTDDGQMDARDPDYYVANRLYKQMLHDGSTFWKVVYEPYMNRDLTSAQVRAVVKKGLVRTSGNYRQVAELFNLEPAEYKKLLNFLRKHNCQEDFKVHRRPVLSIAAS